MLTSFIFFRLAESVLEEKGVVLKSDEHPLDYIEVWERSVQGMIAFPPERLEFDFEEHENGRPVAVFELEELDRGFCRMLIHNLLCFGGKVLVPVNEWEDMVIDSVQEFERIGLVPY